MANGLTGWLVFFQVILDIGLLLGLFLVWARFSRPQKEDARFSKGLQLLQSKISILEDLSDRTDVQVRQLSALLSAKAVEVHQKTAEADRQIQMIEKNMQKSLEISKIFQDKIPHREIIERETSYKYIEAARMANQGKNAEEISKRLEIPVGEAEVIINMNKDQLIFDEANVPAWASKPNSSAVPVLQSQMVTEAQVSPVSSSFNEFGNMMGLPEVDFQHPVPTPSPEIQNSNSQPSQDSASQDSGRVANGGAPASNVRPYEFPRLDAKPRY